MDTDGQHRPSPGSASFPQRHFGFQATTPTSVGQTPPTTIAEEPEKAPATFAPKILKRPNGGHESACLQLDGIAAHAIFWLQKTYQVFDIYSFVLNMSRLSFKVCPADANGDTSSTAMAPTPAHDTSASSHPAPDSDALEDGELVMVSLPAHEDAAAMPSHPEPGEIAAASPTNAADASQDPVARQQVESRSQVTYLLYLRHGLVDRLQTR